MVSLSTIVTHFWRNCSPTIIHWVFIFPLFIHASINLRKVLQYYLSEYGNFVPYNVCPVMIATSHYRNETFDKTIIYLKDIFHTLPFYNFEEILTIFGNNWQHVLSCNSTRLSWITNLSRTNEFKSDTPPGILWVVVANCAISPSLGCKQLSARIPVGLTSLCFSLPCPL